MDQQPQYQMDSLPYKTFQKLKHKYPHKMIYISSQDLASPLFQRVFKNIPTFIKHLFAKEGVEIYRFAHDYKSLDGAHPQLGIIILAPDSVLLDGVEVHALIGMNARYMDKAEGELKA